MNEIIPRIWVGDIDDAIEIHHNDDFLSICVLEGQCQTLHTKQFDVIQYDSEDNIFASYSEMERIYAYVMDQLSETKKDMLIFCGAGIERSPLVVSFIIAKLFCMDIEKAFDWVQKQRPQAQYRLSWIRWGEERGGR